MENSTIANNAGIGAGGIENFGRLLVIRNSAIIANLTDRVYQGGGVQNEGGFVEIINSTIAKKVGASSATGAGGVSNFGGLVSITNSTIRENQGLLLVVAL